MLSELVYQVAEESESLGPGAEIEIVSWVLRAGKPSDIQGEWFSEPKKADEYGARQAALDRDVYLRVSAGTPGAQGHLQNDSSTLGVAVVLDLDTGKAKSPETREQCFELIDSLPFKPTIIVHSGAGLHAWWVYDEPVEDMAWHAKLLKYWVGFAQLAAARRGWAIDPVGHPNRLMRWAPSANHKYDPPLEVTVTACGTPCSPEALWDFISQLEEEEVKQAIEVDDTGIAQALFEGVDPTWLSLQLENGSDKFKLAFSYESFDENASKCDLSIAFYGCKMGWTDLQIAQVIREARFGHDDPRKRKKADRIKYLVDTIRKARQTFQPGKGYARALQEAEKRDLERALDSNDDDDVRAKLEKVLKFEVISLTQYGFADPLYVLKCPEYEIQLSARDMTTFFGFGTRCMPYTKVAPRNSTNWPAIFALLMRITKQVESAHTEPQEIFLEEVRRYIEAVGIGIGKNPQTGWQKSCDEAHPFVWQDRLYVSARKLTDYLSRAVSTRVDMQGVAHQLMLAGFENRVVKYNRTMIDGRVSRNSHNMHGMEVDDLPERWKELVAEAKKLDADDTESDRWPAGDRQDLLGGRTLQPPGE